MKIFVLATALLTAGCYDLDKLRGTVSRCPGLGVQLCDGFETGVLDPRWTPTVHGAAVTIDDHFAYRGTHALRVDVQDPNAAAQGEITERDTFPSDHIFMRAFVYLPTGTPAAPLRVMTPFQPAPPYKGQALYLVPTSTGFAPQVYDGLSDTRFDTQMASFPTDRWVCLEFEVKVGTPGELHVFVDDQEYVDLARTLNTATSPPAGTLSFGLLHEHPSPVHTVWLDEVAVDNQRVGCER
jgi:hypothetical protein